MNERGNGNGMSVELVGVAPSYSDNGSPKNTQTDMMIARQAQEVQAAMIIAKRFPRDQVVSYNRIIDACKRRKLAETAVYRYPRGGKEVTGPSIRLAEALAQNWGNLEYGLTELERKNGESQVMAYAWDLETNTRQTRIFSVKHVRVANNRTYPLTDERDIYELVANNGARRVRTCLLGIIPGDVIEAALEQCSKTLQSASGKNGKPMIDTVRDLANIFKTEYGVTMAQIEKYIGWKSESFSEEDIVKLRQVYVSLRDGMTKKEEVFDMSVGEQAVDALGVGKAASPAKAAITNNTGSKPQNGHEAHSKQERQAEEASNPFADAVKVSGGALPFD